MYDPTETRTCQELLEAAVPPISQPSTNEVAGYNRFELRDTLKRYEVHANSLLTYYQQVFSSYQTTKTSYELVYEKIDEIESALGNIIGPAPLSVMDDFTEDERLREVAGWSAIGGAGFGLLTFTYKLYKLHKARKAFKVAKQTMELGRTLSYAATAQMNLVRLADMTNDIRKIRQAAVATGLLTLVTSAAGIILKVQQDKIEHDSLSSRIESFATWFDDVETRIVQLCEASRYLRGELEALKVELGLPPGPDTDPILVQSLNGQIHAAGEVEAALTTVYRGMCRSEISVDDAIAFSGLPDTPPIRVRLANRRTQLLADSKALCQTEYPDLFD